MVTTIRNVTRNLTGKDGSMPPTTSAASAPPRPGEAAADREGDGEDPVDVDPEPVGDARVVDRRAQAARRSAC